MNKKPRKNFTDSSLARLVEICKLILGDIDVAPNSFTFPSSNPVFFQSIDPTLERGLAGCALVFGETFGRTGDDAYGRVARQLIERAIDLADDLPAAQIGFYNGRTGIFWVAHRLSLLLDDPSLVARAETALDPARIPVRNLEQPGYATGFTSAIPFFLSAPHRDLELAVRLGDRLLDLACREPLGWSWDTHPCCVRHPVGLDGSSGVVMALLDLYAETGFARFRRAAEEGLRYEAQFYDEAMGNWVDLRDPLLLDLLVQARIHGQPIDYQDLRRQQPYGGNFNDSWLFGASGICLVRMRAAAILNRTDLLEPVRPIILRDLAHLEDAEHPSLTLAREWGGILEVVLAAAELLDEPTWVGRVHRAVDRHVAASMSRPSDSPHATTELMYGLAGVGYCLLRLGDSDVPSILMPGTAPKPPQTPRATDAFAVDRDGFFEATRTAFRRLGIDEEPNPPENPSQAHAQLCRRVHAEPDRQRRTLLEDAFLLERSRWSLWAAMTDFTASYARMTPLLDPEDIDWEGAELYLAPGVKVVERQFDWDDWADSDAQPPARVNYQLLFPYGNRICRAPLSREQALFLLAFERPARWSSELFAGCGSTRSFDAFRNLAVAMYRRRLLALNRHRDLADYVESFAVVTSERNSYQTYGHYEALVRKNAGRIHRDLELDDRTLSHFQLERLVLQLTENLRKLHAFHFFEPLIDAFQAAGDFETKCERAREIAAWVGYGFFKNEDYFVSHF